MIDITAIFSKKVSTPFTVQQAFKGIDNEDSPVIISQKVIDRYLRTKQGETLWNYNSGQVRLNPKKPSPTLTKNGDAAYSMFHPDLPRPLLISEMKRIASFPDNFLFVGSYKSVKDRIGNSVPPLMMRSIAEVIRTLLFQQDFQMMQKNNYLTILDDAWQAHLALRETTAPTVISTFAGCGGSSLGYSMAGFRELLAVEWDDNAVETFKLNFPDVPVYHGDIAKLSVDECMRLAGLKSPGDLDVFDGSPPCQGFSTAGRREFTDDRNQLFREYVRLLKGLQPKVFIMENVSGMVKGKMKLIFADIMRELKSTGYLVSARLLNAMYFNVPQSRERMIFIGVRPDIGKAPTHPKAQSQLITARQAFLSVENKTFCRPLATTALKIYNHIQPGQNGTNFRTIPKILPGTGGLMHWQDKRSLSIDEIKCGGSFPSQFNLIGKPDIQWMRIGNSVPPLFMRAIASHIRQDLLST